jgi:hypothetical protein
MPLIIDSLELFPGDSAGENAIRSVLDAAAPACAGGITWKVRVSERPELDGTEVVLEGPVLASVDEDWWPELPGRYVQMVVREGDWEDALRQSIQRMIRQRS